MRADGTDANGRRWGWRVYRSLGSRPVVWSAFYGYISTANKALTEADAKSAAERWIAAARRLAEGRTA